MQSGGLVVVGSFDGVPRTLSIDSLLCSCVRTSPVDIHMCVCAGAGCNGRRLPVSSGGVSRIRGLRNIARSPNSQTRNHIPFSCTLAIASWAGIPNRFVRHICGLSSCFCDTVLPR